MYRFVYHRANDGHDDQNIQWARSKHQRRTKALLPHRIMTVHFKHTHKKFPRLSPPSVSYSSPPPPLRFIVPSSPNHRNTDNNSKLSMPSNYNNSILHPHTHTKNNSPHSPPSSSSSSPSLPLPSRALVFPLAAARIASIPAVSLILRRMAAKSTRGDHFFIHTGWD